MGSWGKVKGGLARPQIGCMKAQAELAALTQVEGSTHGNTGILCVSGGLGWISFCPPVCLGVYMVKLSDLGFRTNLC